MIVYRFEGKNSNTGVYRLLRTDPYLSTYYYGKAISRLVAHPNPLDDGIRDFDDDEFCGFSSLGKLKRWFTLKDLTEFAKSGSVYFAIYKSLYVRHGSKQVVFKRKTARLVSRCKMGCLSLL